MTTQARNLTKQLLEEIINKNKKYTVEEFEEYGREIYDEYGVDGEDFMNAVEEILTMQAEFFDSKGNLDRYMIEEFLTSYGY